MCTTYTASSLLTLSTSRVESVLSGGHIYCCSSELQGAQSFLSVRDPSIHWRDEWATVFRWAIDGSSCFLGDSDSAFAAHRSDIMAGNSPGLEALLYSTSIVQCCCAPLKAAETALVVDAQTLVAIRQAPRSHRGLHLCFSYCDMSIRIKDYHLTKYWDTKETTL